MCLRVCAVDSKKERTLRGAPTHNQSPAAVANRGDTDTDTDTHAHALHFRKKPGSSQPSDCGACIRISPYKAALPELHSTNGLRPAPSNGSHAAVSSFASLLTNLRSSITIRAVLSGPIRLQMWIPHLHRNGPFRGQGGYSLYRSPFPFCVRRAQRPHLPAGKLFASIKYLLLLSPGLGTPVGTGWMAVTPCWQCKRFRSKCIWTPVTMYHQ